MEYIQAKSLLNGRARKKIANNTVAIIDSTEKVLIRLHSTVIISFSPDDIVTISSGGWKTRTTKDRLNKYLPEPWRIYQVSYKWKLENLVTKDCVGFIDGMKLKLEEGEYIPYYPWQYKRTIGLTDQMIGNTK